MSTGEATHSDGVVEWLADLGASPRDQVAPLTTQFVNPDKVHVFASLGIQPLMTERRRFKFRDASGAWLFDAHSNGGTYNLGHRNPELIETMRHGLGFLDMGNHHFLSGLRTKVAQQLVESVPGSEMKYAVMQTSAAEAIDIAVKSARWATGRRGVVSGRDSYHGATGIAMAVGDTRNAEFFHSAGPASEYEQVVFGDIDAMTEAVERIRPAAVVLETIPATLGFVMAPADYYKRVRELCDATDTLLILDEVQVGLGRTARLWAFEHEGIVPDILVTGKGLGGGLYPVGAAVLSERAGGWLKVNGWGNGSTGGGSELGCLIASKVLEISSQPDFLPGVDRCAQKLRAGLDELLAKHVIFTGIRQRGLVLGLEFGHPEGGPLMTQAGYLNGLWAMFAAYDHRVLQVKAGLLMTDEETDELVHLLDKTMSSVERGLGL
jgi:acetylornithine/succinyldiaminopimelate/putrescine aminotransferase